MTYETRNPFPRQSVLTVIGFTVLSLALYLPFWLRKQTRILNRLLPESSISTAWFPICILSILMIYGVVILEIASNDDPNILIISKIVDKLSQLLIVIWTFKVRNRFNELLSLQPDDQGWFNGFLTLIFGAFYLQFKINRIETPASLALSIQPTHQSTKRRHPLKIIGACLAGLFFAAVLGLAILGSMLPETSVYLGHQVPKKYMEEIRSLNLLEEGESIRYFYTDALFDIKEGMYFVTERNLILYSKEWEDPVTIIPFDQIVTVNVMYDESFFEDSRVFVATSSGLEVRFPVSSEQGLDRKFIAAFKLPPEAIIELQKDPDTTYL